MAVAELVAVEGPPGPAWADELRRCWDRGDAVLPVDHRLPRPAVDVLYAALRPTAVVTAGEGNMTARSDGRLAEPGDALVLATSGTTGAPKGVVLTQHAIEASARATSARLDIDPALDTWLCCLPLAHAGGLGVLTRAMITSTPVVVQGRFDARELAAEAARLRSAGRRACVSLVATALRRVDPAWFRVVLLGGDAPPTWGATTWGAPTWAPTWGAAPLGAPTGAPTGATAGAPAWGDGRPPSVVVTYGMTETGGGCVYDGRPLDGVSVIVVDGQIMVRGPLLARAYRSAGADQPLVDLCDLTSGSEGGDDGWFATGDGGRWDGNGRLVVDGRLGDVIVTGGEKVWPAPVESVLRTCPGVVAVAVIGRDDLEWGERVVAVVVPADPSNPPTLGALRAAVCEHLPAWAAPKQIELVAALPTTALGKLKRGELR